MAVKKTDPYAATDNDELLRRSNARLDSELQPDPELAEGPATGGRVALFAIAIVAILGAVFYGLEQSIGHASNRNRRRRPPQQRHRQRPPRRPRHPARQPARP